MVDLVGEYEMCEPDPLGLRTCELWREDERDTTRGWEAYTLFCVGVLLGETGRWGLDVRRWCRDGPATTARRSVSLAWTLRLGLWNMTFLTLSMLMRCWGRRAHSRVGSTSPATDEEDAARLEGLRPSTELRSATEPPLRASRWWSDAESVNARP